MARVIRANIRGTRGLETQGAEQVARGFQSHQNKVRIGCSWGAPKWEDTGVKNMVAQTFL